MKFIVKSNGIEANFNELKHPLNFLDIIKKHETLIREGWHKQIEFKRYLKKIRVDTKSKKNKT